MGAMIAKDAPPALQTLVSALLRTKLELALAGLDGSGKTTMVSALRDPSEPPPGTAPTIGLVVQRARHNGIDLMLWDLGGHHRFREDWTQHVRGCGALLFVVDVSDASRYGEAKQALQRLLEDPVVGGMPLLVLANKVDLLPPARRAQEEAEGWSTLVQALNLDYISADAPGLGLGQRWNVLPVSATRRTNLNRVLRWLVLRAHGAREEALDGAVEVGGGSMWRLWVAVSAPFTGKKKRWGFGFGGRSRYADLADASRSLVDDDYHS